MVFLKYFFEKFDVEKNQQKTKKREKISRGQRVKPLLLNHSKVLLWLLNNFHNNELPITQAPVRSSLQCYSVLSDILVKNELCIPLKRVLNVLSTGEGFICLSPPSKLKIAVRFCSIYKKTISFSAIVF